MGIVDLAKLLRTVQTYVPSAVDLKYSAQRAVRKVSKRPFERDFRALQSLTLSSSKCFIDVGANRGQTVDAIRLTYPLGKIVAFEPNPIMAQRLVSNYAQDANLEVNQCALSSEAGSFALYVPSYRGYVFDGLASLKYSEASDWLKDRIYCFDADKLLVKEFVVQAVKLDDLNLDPAFIKVDVQGSEIDVVLGGEETIRRHNPVLLIEAPEDRLTSMLSGWGFEPHAFQPGIGLIRGRQGTPNTFFVRVEA